MGNYIQHMKPINMCSTAPVLRVCSNSVDAEVQARQAWLQALARHHLVWEQQAVAPGIHVYQLSGALQQKC